MSTVVILDYGHGNVRSALRAIETTGVTARITSDFDDALSADGLLVPGVGAFGSCVSALRSVRGDQIIERRLAGGLPVLGICVGMQILFASSTEHADTNNFAGLDQWPGIVRALDAPVLPHMGWNTVRAADNSHMFQGIAQERFYFVHSYGVTSWDLPDHDYLEPPRVSWSHYGEQFVAAVENGPLWATQFHPEKSGQAGLTLLANWVSTFSEKS